jgi:hypothetical protein
MKQSKAMEYESRKASSNVLNPRNICIYIYIYIYIYISKMLNPRITTGCLPKETRFVYSLPLLLYSKLSFSLLLHTHTHTHTHIRTHKNTHINTLTSCYSNSSTIVCDLHKLLLGYKYDTVCGLRQSGKRHLKWSRAPVLSLIFKRRNVICFI